MNIVLWILQVLLAVAFGMFGFNKISQPIDGLVGMMPWVTAVPALLVRFIGVAEVAGALGLLLPKLTAWAAAGLATVMVLAAIFHATRGEFGNIGFNAVLLVLAAVVAWGRWRS
jgi:putative oxidoreductase